MMIKRRFFFAFLSFLLTIEPTLYALDTGVSGVDFEYYHPATDAYGIFGVNSPRTMKAGKFYFNLSQSFTRGKFLRVTTGGTTINLVDRIYTTDLVTSLGISDFLTIGAEVPFHIYAKEANLTSLADFTTRGIGDVVGFLKFRVLEDASWWPGIALLYTNSFPTGDESRFFGTTHVVPGVQLALGKETKYFTFAANAGALFPQGKTVLGAMFNDKVTYGAGIKVPFGFLDPNLSVMAEVRGFFEIDKVQVLTAPVEFTTGLRKEFCNGLALTAGGGGGWNDAVGNPTIRGIGAISFTSAGDRCSKTAKEEIKVVMKEEAEPTPLTATPEPKAPATKSIAPTPQKEKKSVAQPKSEKPIKREKVAESLANQIHTTVYFGFGSTQPTKESSSWVTEAAELLKAHPKVSLVLVEGHTDNVGGKAANQRLSLRRAQAIKKMLVQKGIHPSRITVEGRGPDQPVAPNTTKSGRSLNRRAEIQVSH